MKKILIISLISCILKVGFSQEITTADSLKLLIQNSTHDTTKVKLYNELAIYYMGTNKDFSIENSQYSIKLAEKTNQLAELANSYKLIGTAHFYKSNYELALRSFEKAATIYKQIENQKGESACYNNIGSVHIAQGSYLIALEFFQKSLKIRTELKHERGIASTLNNIGETYRHQKDYDKALEYYQKSLEKNTEIGNKSGISASLNNMGIVSTKKENYQQALQFYKKSLSLKIEIDEKNGIAMCYNNIGEVYRHLADYTTALQYFNKSLKISQLSGYTSLIAENFENIAKVYFEREQYDKAQYFIEKSLIIRIELNEKKSQLNCYKILSDIYNQKQNYKLAYENYIKYQDLNDSIFSNEKARKIAEAHMQYLHNQEKEIEKLKQEKKEQEYQTRLNKERYLRYSFIITLFVMLIFSGFFYRSSKIKKATNKVLSFKNKKINEQKTELKIQRDIATQKNNEIMASIGYAEKIQRAILPTEATFSSIFPQHFVLFKPKDIVSGDFYWLKKIKNFAILATVDCTGHGVPGAFMSMLGSSFLNEIVSARRLDNPGAMLDRLRNKIKKTLHQAEGGAQDGMDIALYSINLETLELKYAGAYNPLWIVRNEKLKIKNEDSKENKNNQKFEKSNNSKPQNFKTSKLIEIKADRQPIGKYVLEKNFQTQKFQLQKGDTLYTFSDGYADQFGGEEPEPRKYYSKNLKKLLLSIQNKTMKEQKKILKKNFEQWKGKNEQVDDVLLIGVKIS